MQEQYQAQFHYFRDMAYLFLGTKLFDVDRKLVPGEYLDHTLIPEEIGRSYDALLFGGALFDCRPKSICQFRTSFSICFCVLQLEPPDGYAVIGPYLPDVDQTGATLDALLLQNNVPLSSREKFRIYYDQLPTVSTLKAVSIMRGLPVHLYGWDPGGEVRLIDLGEKSPAPCPVFREDALDAWADSIQHRYEREQQLLDAVARGDDNAVNLMGQFALDRLPNRLRDEKNKMIVLNTLLRKAVERSKLHPVYIDEISGKWMLRIESAQTVSRLGAYYHDIILEYCALVRKHSLAQYTHYVRKAINCIRFNLDNPELTLTLIAGSVSVNATYLSHQFNKEVGRSIPAFITGQRIAQAQNLLLTNAGLPIGRIAAAVGFQDVNYFSQSFKRAVGCTPTVYRSKNRK